MSCCSVFGKWAHFPKGIAGAYSQVKAQALACRGPVGSSGRERSLWGTHHSQSSPNQTPLLVTEKQCKEGILPWLRVQAWGSEVSGHRRAWWASERPTPWQHRGSVLQPRVCLEAPPAQRSEQRGRHCFPQGDGWWRREQAVFCPWVKTPPPAAHSGSNSCPVTPGFAHHAPCPTGNELGKVDPQSWELSTVVNTSPHLLNNFKSLIQSKCHMHWIYQFSIRLCILKTSPFG